MVLHLEVCNMTITHETIYEKRSDLSPFLIHLTKDRNGKKSGDIIHEILDDRKLKTGNNIQSSLCFINGTCGQYPRYLPLDTNNDPEITTREGNKTYNGCPGPANDFYNEIDQIKKFLNSLCLTETPLTEIHWSIDISRRGSNEEQGEYNLSKYGIVLIKDVLVKTYRINPVFNISSYNKDNKLNLFWSNSSEHWSKCTLEYLWYYAYKHIYRTDLPEFTNRDRNKALLELMVFFKNFGYTWAKENSNNDDKIVDYYWEREWRSLDDIELIWDINNPNCNVFMGLCPNNNDEISELEKKYEGLPFIDPKNVEEYRVKINKRKEKLEELSSNKLGNILPEPISIDTILEYIKNNKDKPEVIEAIKKVL